MADGVRNAGREEAMAERQFETNDSRAKILGLNANAMFGYGLPEHPNRD